MGALLLSRLLTFGWVPIQASSGAHGWAPPPLRTPPGPRPLQPGVGSESPRSSMRGRAASGWCTAPRARPEAGARASGFRFPGAPRLRAEVGTHREESEMSSSLWQMQLEPQPTRSHFQFIQIWAEKGRGGEFKSTLRPEALNSPPVDATCSPVEKVGNTEGAWVFNLITGKASFCSLSGEF